MPTRHLYETQAVCAQLLYSLFNGQTRLAIHAARELVDSELNDLLFKILTFAWMLQDPGHRDEYHRYKLFEAQNTKNLLFSLLSERACELPEIPKSYDLPHPTEDTKLPCASWTQLPRGYTPLEAGRLYWAIFRSLEKKHHDRAYRLSLQLLQSNTLSLVNLLESFGIARQFSELLTTSVFAPFSQRILQHAFAIAAAAASAAQATIEYPAAERTWRAKPVGGTAGRTFSIDPSALAMWHVRPKSIDRLIGMPTLVFDETACPYWSRIIADTGATLADDDILFETPDAQEIFYSQQFPNDIPDEWSREERQKSHGISVPAAAKKNPWQVAFLLCWA